MGNNNPLEHLTAFAICFAAGVVSTYLLRAYIGKLKRTESPTQSQS